VTADPTRVIRSYRTFADARAVEERLRRWGIPKSEVRLRIKGLEFKKSQDRMLLFVAIWGAAAFAVHLPVGLMLYITQGVSWVMPMTIAVLGPVLLLVAWWLVRRYSPDPMAGYAIPKRVDLEVTERYADDALRILAAIDD
jgi:hypothetical protein